MDAGLSTKKQVSRAAAGQDGATGIVRRWIATWIDFVAVFGCILALAMPLGIMQEVTGQKLDDDVFLLVGLGAVIVALGYYTLCEGLWGRTVGKLITGMVVVGPTGGKPGLLRAFLRTLLRLVEVNPFLLGGVPAGLIVALSPKKQRLGDMLAGTYVLPVSELRSIQRQTIDVF